MLIIYFAKNLIFWKKRPIFQCALQQHWKNIRLVFYVKCLAALCLSIGLLYSRKVTTWAAHASDSLTWRTCFHHHSSLLAQAWAASCTSIKLSLSPKCSANPITVKPIWKCKFENKEHPIRGLYMTFFERFLFKFPFWHKRFQMGQKMYFHQLYKL